MSLSNYKQQLGIHITEHSIRVVEVINYGHLVQNFGQLRLSKTFSELKKSYDAAELSQLLHDALINTKPQAVKTRQAVVVIGDEEAFTKIVTMPKMELKEARAAAPNELESDLPLKAEDMYIDLFVLNQEASRDQMEVMVFAISRKTIDWLLTAASIVKLKLQAIETTSIPLGRLYSDKATTYLTADIGSSYSAIAIFDQDLMHVSNTASLQDPIWSESLSQGNFTLSEAQVAEQFKLMLSNLIEKIQASLRYYYNRGDQTKTIEKIFISGSGARMPHLDSILAKHLELPVEIGQAPVNCQHQEHYDSGLLVPLGAALRRIDE